MSVRRTRAMPARYFAPIICQSESGFVSIISMVPVRRSSANERIVTEGTRNKNTHGASTNRLSRLAYPYDKMLKSLLKTHKNSPVMSKNTTTTVIPMSELRKLLISFLKRAYIFNCIYEILQR